MFERNFKQYNLNYYAKTLNKESTLQLKISNLCFYFGTNDFSSFFSLENIVVKKNFETDSNSKCFAPSYALATLSRIISSLAKKVSTFSV